MFERFTERGRQSVVLAQDEARTLRHPYIGTEHILLGLLREDGGLAARALVSLDLTVERVRARIVDIVGSGEEVVSGQIPFTPRAKKALELALREAISLSHKYIGTEHILLGLLRDPEAVAARVMVDLGVAPGAVRDAVLRVLDDPELLKTRNREQLIEKAAFFDARLEASRRLDEVAAIVAGAEDPQAAIRDLRDTLNVAEEHARWILTADLLLFTRSEARKATATRAEIQRAIEEIDATDG